MRLERCAPRDHGDEHQLSFFVGAVVTKTVAPALVVIGSPARSLKKQE